jgi:hypothetical protein
MERNSIIISHLINKDTAIRNLLSKYGIAEGTDFGPDTFAAVPETELATLLGLTVQFVFNSLKAPTVKDVFDESGIVETFSEPMGMYLQRIHYNAIKQIGPFYQAENTAIPSQFDKRLATTVERFLKKNMDYQNLISQLDDVTVQKIFASEYGIASFLSGPAMVLDASYKLYKTLTVYEVLNSILNNTEYPLKDSQKLNITLSDTPSKEDLREFILAIKNKVSQMNIHPSTDQYNSGGYAHFFEPSNHVLLLKPGVMNMIQTHLLENSYNMEMLNLPIEVREVMHFGGLIPTSDGSTPLYPVYDKWASLIGFNTAPKKTEVTVTEDDVVWVDPNPDVVGMIIEKGAIVYNDANPMSTPTVRNELGMFTNLIANKPGCSMNYDPDYNVVAIINGPYADSLGITEVDKGTSAGETDITVTDSFESGQVLIYTVTETPVTGLRQGEVIEGVGTPVETTPGSTPTPTDVTVEAEAGQYVTIYEVDGDGHLYRYTTLLITPDVIGSSD